MRRVRSSLCLSSGLLAISLLLMGCATPLTSEQKAELNVYRTKGLEVAEKDPAVGKALGILPGGGSFYAGEYGLGFVNFMLWPVSMMWDPISGSNGAEVANYRATRSKVEQRRAVDMHVINTQLEQGHLTSEAYTAERERIDRKYAPQI